MTDWKVPLTSITLPESDVEAVMETLRSGWLTMGPRTQELEEVFKAEVGAEHAVAVSSAAAALHLACLAAGVGSGDEVIVPALAFVASAHAPRIAGGKVVFCDCVSAVEPLMDPADVERRITDRTKAVIAVHRFGYPADIDALQSLCDEHGLALIEDCAEADGGSLRDGSPAGCRGLLGCFSFLSKTPLGVGEGGIVVSDDDEAATKVRSLRSHAMTSVTWDRHRGHAETYDVTDLGFNYRLDEPRASLALARLGRLDQSIAHLRQLAGAYREGIASVDGVEVPFSDELVALSGHFAFPVLLADGRTRDAVREAMHAARVQTTFYPALTQLSEYHQPDRPLPVAEEFAARHLAMPLSTGLYIDGVDTAVEALASAVALAD